MSQENRQEQYLQLIKKILDTSQNTGAILSGHSNLVDEGLLVVMARVAVEMREAGQNDIAEFLDNVVEQLGKALGIKVTQKTQSEEAYLQFLMELLQTVSDSGSNPRTVYSFLQQNLSYLDENLVRLLQQWATKTFAQVPEEKALDIALIIGEFGNLIQQFPLGQRWINLELGIICYEIVLQVFPRDQQPEMWAATQNNLAAAYSERILGDRAANIEAAIKSYANALEVRTRKAFPEDWASTQNNLAAAYKNRIRGDRAANIEEAIKACENALEVYTRKAFPEQWATTQNNLATAYSERILGDRAANIEEAIKGYANALEVRTPEAFPEQWASTQNNLAAAYSERILGDRAANIEEAIKGYANALEVRTLEAFPKQWAATQNNLANAYSRRIRGSKKENLEQAIIAYQRALQVYTRETFPVDWAVTQNNLANAYRKRIKEERGDNIEGAIAAYKLALEVYTHEAFPEQWTEIQNNLATTYSDLGSDLVREGKWQEGLKYLQNSANKFSSSNNKVSYADVLLKLGKTYEYFNDWTNARMYYRDALRVYEHLKDLLGIAKSQEGLGRILLFQGYLEKGMSYLDQSIQNYHDLENIDKIKELEKLLYASQCALEKNNKKEIIDG